MVDTAKPCGKTCGCITLWREEGKSCEQAVNNWTSFQSDIVQIMVVIPGYL